jgi:predicted phosphodiesterase
VRTQILSDIHTEFHRDGGVGFINALDPTDVDVIILAGDVSNAKGIIPTLERICVRYRKAQVLYVPGNHEMYGSSPRQVLKALRKFGKKNFHMLYNSTLTLEGITFAGTPLWFRQDPINVLYQNQMSDFSQIQDFTPWVYDENQKAEAFVRALGPPDVMVTHYLPSYACVNDRYATSPLNRFFVSPIVDTLERLPRLWVFGHTHSHVDFEMGGCRFLANPFGYPSEGAKDFVDRLLIDLGGSDSAGMERDRAVPEGSSEVQTADTPRGD